MFNLVHNCRYGRFLVPPDDTYVGNALRYYGEYSQIELDLLLQLVPLAPDGKPMLRVVAVGANIGALVVPLAQKALEVVAFEPQRWVFQLLCANLALNDLINVRAYWAAVGATPGGLRCPILRPDVTNNFGALELPAVQEMEGDIVPRMTLDSVPNIDMGLLTIDVEGMELDVLRGAEKTIERCRPAIFFEADRAGSRQLVFEWLRERKYRLFWYKTPLFNKDNFAKNVEDIWGKGKMMVIAENVLAVPIEKHYEMNGFTAVT